MSRRLSILGLFLLLGALATVAASWSSFLLLDRQMTGEATLPASKWPCSVPGHWEAPGSTVVSWNLWRTCAQTRSAGEFGPPGGTRAPVPRFEVNTWSFGFPVRALEMTYLADHGPLIATGGASIVARRGVIELPDAIASRIRASALPWVPVWPGFLIDSVTFGAALWVLTAVPIAWRRGARVRRGLCARCAYAVGNLAQCPECGHTRP
ncbi:MAG: hypothetical protein KF745_14335 [Phycisphaeraceae bacterium]|nr:hypothetical protein [Phycisphaeraceae bacterium]